MSNKRLHNATDRIPLTHNNQVVDVYSAADLPAEIIAPDGVLRRPLAVGTTYRIHKDFICPRLLFPRITTQVAFEATELAGLRADVNILVDGDTTPHFWGRDNSAVVFRNTSLVDIGNNGAGRSTTLFDLVGGAPTANFAVLFSGFFNAASMGTITDMPLFIDGWVVSGLERGLTFRSNSSDIFHTVGTLQFVNPVIPMKKPALSFNGPIDTLSLNGGNIRLLSNDSYLHIDSAATGTFDVIGISYGGTTKGNFFRPDVSESLTAMAAANKSITGFFNSGGNPPITSVTVGTFGSNFTHDGILEFHVNDSVFHANFANSSYNGFHVITAIVSPTVYQISTIIFISDDGGDVTLDETGVNATNHKLTVGQTILIANSTIGVYNGIKTVKRVSPDEQTFFLDQTFEGTNTADVVITKVTTSNDHPMTVGETQTISGTTSYNGTTRILFVDDNTFDIPVEFVANDATGTVISSSKTEKSVGINSRANGAQADSDRIAEGSANSNTTLTTVTDGAYAVITLTGFTADASTERFTLTTAANAIWTYDDPKPFSGRVVAAISGTKTGSTANYRFAISINGATPVFAAATFAPMEVKTNKVQTVLSLPVTLIQNDTVQVMVAGDSTGDDITITDISISIR